MSDETSDNPDGVESLLARHRPAAARPDVRVAILRQAQRQARWSFCEAIAATVLIGATLGQIGVSVARFKPPRPATAVRTQQLAEEIARLNLPLSPGETGVLADQLAAGERLRPLPVLHGDAAFGAVASQGVLP